MPSYTAIRTDKSKSDFIVEELLNGRLRQGWGHEPNQDLRLVCETPSANRDNNQNASWRGNRRLLDDVAGGLESGDVIVLPNLPAPGCWAIARISGPYRYEIERDLRDYGHIRDVKPVRNPDGETLTWVAPTHELVPAAMRRSMTCRSRMWSLDAFGNSIDLILSKLDLGEDLTQGQNPDDRFQSFVSGMRLRAMELVDHGWAAAELEDLIVRLLRHKYRSVNPNSRVEAKGGAGEHGIDVLVTLPDPLGISLKIGVQVKKHDGIESDSHSLDQIAEAHKYWGLHAGIVLTTATEISGEVELRREALSEQLGIDIQVICQDQFVDLLLEQLAAE